MKIKSNYFGRLLISYYHCVKSHIIPRMKPDEQAVKEFYKYKTGKELDLSNPVTFSEKMNWYKINGRIAIMQQCADKVGVRDYIKSKGYSDHLNEIYGVYNKARDIPFNDLPEKYVIKAAHGSHMNIINDGITPLKIWQTKLLIHSWLHQNIYWGGREWVYKDIPRRIIIEKYLKDETGELKDYKFFCFNGEPTYLQYDGGRFMGNHFRNYYNINYDLLPLRDDVPNNPNEKLPIGRETLDQMKNIAKVLSAPFQFVRVDFYYVNGKIYVGELTFFHNGGITWFQPESFDEEFGSKWTLVSDSVVK